MAQTTLFPPAEIPEVQPGDVFQLGEKHRLMCGDATDKDAVAHLFGDDAPTLVVTSPPYANQRDYDRPIACWESMMMGALNGHPFSDDCQMLINLGPIHRNKEFLPYWEPWLSQMRAAGWLRHAQYIWHKVNGLPQAIKTRLTTNYEFIFHLNKLQICANKNRTNKSVGENIVNKTSRQRTKANIKAKSYTAWEEVSALSVQNAVLPLPILHPKESTEHPAQFPSILPATLIGCFQKEGAVVYDPFAGSGTIFHAGEQQGVTALGCEISPAYCQIALRRWAKEHPDKPIRRV